jgi:DNA primase
MSVDFSTVKEQVPVSLFFDMHMGASKAVAGGQRYAACPACGHSSSSKSVRCSVRNNRWHCFSCAQKGDVIDAAAYLFGISHALAAEQLLEGSSEIPEDVKRRAFQAPTPVRNDDAVALVIDKLIAAQADMDPAVEKYLIGRGISKQVIQEALARGILVSLPSNPDKAIRHLVDNVGIELLKEAGMWKKDAKAPGIIYRPLAFVSHNRRSIEFRLIEESEQKVKVIRYGAPAQLLWENSDIVMMTEGPVDMLSAVVMGTQRTIIGLPGANVWINWGQEWLEQFRGKQILLCFDNDFTAKDNPGQTAQAKLTEALQAVGAKVHSYRLPQGVKDLNDELKLKLSMN